MNNGQQRQRHRVTKNLVENNGGALVGAAVMLLLMDFLKQRAKAQSAWELPRRWPSLHDMAPQGDRERRLAKGDRWLIGFVAGAALIYMLGRSLGLGEAKRNRS